MTSTIGVYQGFRVDLADGEDGESVKFFVFNTARWFESHSLRVPRARHSESVRLSSTQLAILSRCSTIFSFPLSGTLRSLADHFKSDVNPLTGSCGFGTLLWAGVGERFARRE